ncbi:MAG: hypothetical protein DCF22_03050 [Leptolyngbya sp.]|nr:MAG: hypothetical protein DCF22_03050 [Leptolyngbya sp.]
MATALRSQRPVARDSPRDSPSETLRERFTNRPSAPRRKAHLQPVQGATSVRNRKTPNAPLAAVSQLSTARLLPNWLRLLMQAQRGSLVVTFALVVATLMVYGGTMYMQQLWGKEYRKLKTMQRSERQMLAASEVLKNQIIQQAESPNSGLVAKTPQHTLILESAPIRTVKPAAIPVVIRAEASTNAPLGY